MDSVQQHDRFSKIIKEICFSLSLLGSDSNLVSVVASWKDTLPEEDVLVMLQTTNKRMMEEKTKDLMVLQELYK